MNLRALQWVVLGVAFGAAAGIGGYTFIYAKGYSYLTNNPAACANCHVMEEQYSGWLKSSHRSVATCNDCHTPPGFFGKYYTKASNGFWHSYYFTTDTFHEPIQITKRNHEITEQACRNCHQPVVEAIEGPHQGQISCVRCHLSVGHMH
ncbi:MAG TPA: cytochrome c nitrite reductase small subunit [Pyrinomonadaceae bacterium]|nr:cytochrome c nitrite reductase small subunit [Pyrinomonadaceae bacterium]